jgi:glycerol-3-phosphate acyltransferase PlsX
MGVTVAVDANGADLGPAEVARGAARAVAADPDLRVLLFGPAAEIGEVGDRVEVVDAPVSIAKDPDPARAVRANRDASIVQAWAADAGALVSGGSTGAALAAGLFGVKRMRGVYRPALAIVVPVPGNPFLLLDVGANVDVRPEHLVQFAHMGAAYSRVVLGIASPRVGLLSNGTEPGKGTEDIVAAGEALRDMPGFVGNVEGFTVAAGDADVVVTDGFTGNVMVKTMEGTAKALLGAVRDAALSSSRAKAGGFLLRPALGGLRQGVDPEESGGALLLGLRRPGVVPHGSFTERGFARAIEMAAKAVREDIGGRTHADLEAAGALRRSRDPSEDAATVPDR